MRTQLSDRRFRIVIPMIFVAIVLLVMLCRFGPAPAWMKIGGDTVTVESLGPLPDLGPPLESFRQAPNGPGLVVCEPVNVKASSEIADFGTGCGRWLHLQVSGLGELSKTPLWTSLGRIRKELRRADSRLSLPQAANLVRILGVTHVAVGTIAGTPAKCTLTYQVWRVPEGHAVGAPITLSGTQAQVLEQLPAMARQIGALLGVTAPILPTRIGIAPGDLAFLGRLPLIDPVPARDAVATRLLTLSQRDPLAGLLLMDRAVYLTSSEWDGLENALLDQAPSNTLVMGHIAVRINNKLDRYVQKIAGLQHKYPNNFQLDIADALVSAEFSDMPARLKATERALCDSYNSPVAWETVSLLMNDLAQLVRQGRYATIISPTDEAFLNVAYVRQGQAALRATQIDPDWSQAWLTFAKAETCTSLGDPRDSFWKAARLDSTDVNLLCWGLEMFQPKWGGDPDDLKRAAELASKSHLPAAGSVRQIAANLREAGYGSIASDIVARARDREEQALSRNPHDPAAHWDAFVLERGQGQRDRAIAHLRAILNDYPDDAFAWDELGRALLDGRDYDGAIEAFRKVADFGPDLGISDFRLGLVYAEQRQYSAAVRAFRRSLVGMNKYNVAAWTEMSNAYKNSGRNDEAIDAAMHALQISPRSPRGFTVLEFAYDQTQQYKKSIVCLRYLQQLYPDDKWTNETLAKDLRR